MEPYKPLNTPFNGIWKPFKLLCDSLLHIVYPPRCIHCEEALEEASTPFCRPCLELTSLIDPATRCKKCFGEWEDRSHRICPECRGHSHLFKALGASWPYYGPPATLIKKMKYGNQPYLAEGVAGFMAAQFISLDWPLPDLIVPVPMPSLRQMERGYNQSVLIAEHLGAILTVPVKEILGRYNGTVSQAGLSQGQRKKLVFESFYRKDFHTIEGNRILLIDDVHTTGTTLRHCAYVLWQGRPKEVYALTACYTA